MSSKYIVDYNAIVIAEDDLSLALDFMNYFEVAGYVVRVVDRRDDIMATLREARAGWLLLDIELKDGLGYEVIPLIRNMYGKDVFVVVLTGQWERHTEDESLKRGANLVFRKPRPPSTLKMQMDSYLDYA